MIRKFAFATASLSLGAAAYDRYTETYVVTRTLRTVRCGLHILYSYKIAFNE